MTTGTVKWFNPTKEYGFTAPSDGSTYRLAGGLFVCDDLGPQRLKGMPETAPEPSGEFG